MKKSTTKTKKSEVTAEEYRPPTADEKLEADLRLRESALKKLGCTNDKFLEIALSFLSKNLDPRLAFENGSQEAAEKALAFVVTCNDVLKESEARLHRKPPKMNSMALAESRAAFASLLDYNKLTVYVTDQQGRPGRAKDYFEDFLKVKYPDGKERAKVIYDYSKFGEWPEGAHLLRNEYRAWKGLSEPNKNNSKKAFSPKLPTLKGALPKKRNPLPRIP